MRSYFFLLLFFYMILEVGPFQGLAFAGVSAGQVEKAWVVPDMPCAEAANRPSGNFQVKLDPKQEARAQRLYRTSIIITAHDHCLHPQDFRAQAESGITVRTIKLTTDGVYWTGGKRHLLSNHLPGWEQEGMKALEFVRKQASNSQGELVVIRNVADIERTKRERKIGAILSFEGARPLEGKLENLQLFYDAGLRDLQLFWAVPTPLKAQRGGLTAFGLAVIQEMNRLGMVIDLSHMNARAFQQALAATKHPVLISHGGVLALHSSTADETKSKGTDHLSDTDIRALAKNGGVLCLHFLEGYIDPHHGRHSSVEDLVDLIEHIRKLVGPDHVALGTDYFAETGLHWIEGAEQMSDLINVVREMVRRGFSDSEIQKVLGLNLMRVYKKVWKVSPQDR